jgi:1-deoxy-D-xylulose-5-phosphate reductoisomerase
VAKRICLLGSTGSIGTQTLEVIQRLNRGQRELRFDIIALAAGENITLLAQQIREFHPQWVCLKREQDMDALKRRLGALANKIKLFAGEEGLRHLSTESSADLVVNGLVGAVGLLPSLAALGAGIDVALANKESLVIGGHLVKEVLQQSRAQLIPVDSEHSALFQLLEAHRRSDVSRVVLTASGGALRDWPLDQLHRVRPQDVLQHPTWRMGQRITVDSATLVNKAFEVMEAHWLFELPFEQIDVLMHPQSIVHGLVELCDGSVLAHWGVPDMRGPIQFALSYPERAQNSFERLDWSSLRLEFSRLDERRYPAFAMVVEAGRKGGTLPAVVNAADEVAVERFLKGDISFTQIHVVLENVLEAHTPTASPDAEAVREADRWARELAQALL